MTHKEIKAKALEIALNCNSAKEINNNVKTLIESGFTKDDSISIVKFAKEIRVNRLATIKTQVNGLKYDGVKTLSAIFSAEFGKKDWKTISAKNPAFARIDSLESFLLSYFSKVSESGKLIIVRKDKESGNKVARERNLSKVNATSIWNNCIANVLRETSGKGKIQTIYKDSEFIALV